MKSLSGEGGPAPTLMASRCIPGLTNPPVERPAMHQAWSGWRRMRRRRRWPCCRWACAAAPGAARWTQPPARSCAPAMSRSWSPPATGAAPRARDLAHALTLTLSLSLKVSGPCYPWRSPCQAEAPAAVAAGEQRASERQPIPCLLAPQHLLAIMGWACREAPEQVII